MVSLAQPALIGPVIPDANAIFNQVANIGIAANKPQQFMEYRFEMNFFSCHQGKALAQIKAHLVAENTLSAGTGAIFFFYAVITNMFN